MKVVGEAPTGRSRRLIVTEHGISYGGRPLRKRSAHSSRRSHDLRGEDEKVVHRAKGHRWSAFGSHAVREMRRARVALNVTCYCEATRVNAGERSDTETVTLRSARGNWKRAIARWYLASCLLNLDYPFTKSVVGGRTISLCNPTSWSVFST